MKKWKVAIPVLVIIALFFAWYAFRPERLVVNHRVHEEFPTAKGGSPEQTLASGTFYGVAHPTTDTATIYRIGTAVAFFVSRASGHRTALTFTSTWWLPTMQKTAQVCRARASSIWDP
jgi:hypothetical protein